MNVLLLTLHLVGIFACGYLMRWRFSRGGQLLEGATFLWRTFLFGCGVALLFGVLDLLGVVL